MKKLLSLLLVAAMGLSLVGCGGSDSGSKSESKSDLEYVKDKGTLVVGITDFAPMDYKDESGNWIGFDADMASAFAESLGVKAEFVEIDWDNKIMELDGKTIDCVWNGMTLTDEVTSSMACSDAYCNNAQVLARGVVRAVGEPLRRFGEDALRILRLYRFAARFGFAIDPATDAAAKELCRHLNCVSLERIEEELSRLLEAPRPGRWMEPEIFADRKSVV